MAFGFTLAPNTHNTDLITTAVTATATTIARTNIGGTNGTGTIIVTITIEITIGIEIYEIITFYACAGRWRIGFSIL
jgi:hypothetical protein